MITVLHRGGYAQMITILHRGGYAQMITILHRGGGVFRDPQKWLRNMCTTPYLGTHASVPGNVEDQEDVADTLAVQLNIFLNFHLEYLSS